MVIDRFNFEINANRNVGISTANPSARLDITSGGSTSATQILRLSNSSSVNLLTINDDGSFNGKNIAVSEYTGSVRLGENAATTATGSYWTAIGYEADHPAQMAQIGQQWVEQLGQVIPQDPIDCHW